MSEWDYYEEMLSDDDSVFLTKIANKIYSGEIIQGSSL